MGKEVVAIIDVGGALTDEFLSWHQEAKWRCVGIDAKITMDVCIWVNTHQPDCLSSFFEVIAICSLGICFLSVNNRDAQ